MSEIVGFFEPHIFCCINEREEGHKRGSCGAAGSKKLQKYMKARMKEEGFEGFRVNKCGCLDRCELGPVLVIYPQGIWYHYKNRDDIDAIIETHLKKGEIVEHLVIHNDQDKELEPRQKAEA